MASGVKEWDFPGSFIEYFLCFQFSFNSKCVFCLIYVSDGRNETLKATLFLVVADVRDPRILDLMILTPMILAPSRCRRAWQRDGQSLEGEILQKVFFCDGALGSILWDSSTRTRSWISFWFPASLIVNSSLLVTCERKLNFWQQTRHIGGHQGGIKCGNRGTRFLDSKDPKHTLFCRKTAFVAIYALFKG